MISLLRIGGRTDGSPAAWLGIASIGHRDAGLRRPQRWFPLDLSWRRRAGRRCDLLRRGDRRRRQRRGLRRRRAPAHARRLGDGLLGLLVGSAGLGADQRERRRLALARRAGRAAAPSRRGAPRAAASSPTASSLPGRASARFAAVTPTTGVVSSRPAFASSSRSSLGLLGSWGRPGNTLKGSLDFGFGLRSEDLLALLERHRRHHRREQPGALLAGALREHHLDDLLAARAQLVEPDAHARAPCSAWRRRARASSAPCPHQR